MWWIDHVIRGVQDLESAGGRLEMEYGLPPSDGGIHPGGARNAVVACQDGTTYIEFLAVHDPAGPTAHLRARLTQKRSDKRRPGVSADDTKTRLTASSRCVFPGEHAESQMTAVTRRAA
jgi:hypothetical protein